MKKILSLIVLLGFSLKSNAALINFDAFSNGDGLAAYDASTNLVWLDLSETTGLSYNDALTTINAIDSDWRYATNAEVNALTAKMFPSYAPNHALQYQINCPAGDSCYTEAEAWLDVLGVTPDINNDQVQYSFGFYSDENNVLRMSGTRINFITEFANLYGESFAVDYNFYRNRGSLYNYGSFLVKEGVVEASAPSALGLLAFGLIALRVRRRKS